MHKHRICLPKYAKWDDDWKSAAQKKQGWKPSALPAGVPTQWRRARPYHRKKKVT